MFGWRLVGPKQLTKRNRPLGCLLAGLLLAHGPESDARCLRNAVLLLSLNFVCRSQTTGFPVCEHTSFVVI